MQVDIATFFDGFLPSGGGQGPGYVLGIAVSARHLHGLLIDRSGEGARVVQRFTRRRSGGGSEGGGYEGAYGGDYDDRFASEGGGMPGMEAEETTGEDFTIQFGGEGNSGGDHLFLESEFGNLEGDFSAGGSGSSAFSLELSDLLDECREAGYADPALAFCLPGTGVEQHEIRLDDVEASAEEPATVERVGRRALRKALEAQRDGDLEKGRFAFLPMTPDEDGAARFLALIARPADPIVSTLGTMKEQGTRLPGRGSLETEVSLYFGLARMALRHTGAENEDALVVRVGAEDTLALFTSGSSLRHTETLRSLTAQDDPETVCSRVLLLQDEYGIDDMQHVFVVGDAAESALVESFEMFFPEAHVEPLRRHLPVETAADEGAASVTAAAAALRFSRHAGFDIGFEEVDLLPPKLLIRRFELPFSNAVPGLLVLLTIVGIFFGVRYRSLQIEQEAVRRRLAVYPENVADATPKQLQTQIDSIRNASASYREGLETLDDLLMGSDQWSHALATITRETAAVSGIWVEEWTPQTNAVRLQGNATSRDRVIQLAERTSGEIQNVTFSEIREWPVYSFAMTVPLKTGLPSATQYLRERALAEADSSTGARGQNAGGRPARPPAGNASTSSTPAASN